MKNLKLKSVCFEENLVIHCPENWQSQIVRELAHDMGFKWAGGANLKNVTRCYSDEQCLSLNEGKSVTWSYRCSRKNVGYKILPFQEAIQVMLHNQPLDVGDGVFPRELNETLIVENIDISSENKCDIIFESGDELSYQINFLNECLAWQNPYECSDQWRAKPEATFQEVIEYPFTESKANTMCHYCKHAKISDPLPGCAIARCECTKKSFNKYTGNRVNLADKNHGDCPVFEEIKGTNNGK